MKKLLIAKIIMTIIWVACLAYVIYSYVKNDVLDAWMLCVCIFVTLTLAFFYLPKLFIISKNAKRNRIILYISLICCTAIPNLIYIILQFSTGKYIANESIMTLIDSGVSVIVAELLWILGVLILYAIVCAIDLIYIEKSLISKTQQEVLSKVEEIKNMLSAQNENQNEDKKE